MLKQSNHQMRPQQIAMLLLVEGLAAALGLLTDQGGGG